MEGLEELAPDSQDEFEQRQKELLKETREAKAEREAKQNEALQAIAEGGDLEEYETVALGDLELEVKAWLPGETTETVQQAMSMADSEDLSQIKRSMDTMLSALADMTVDDTFDVGFWRKYYQKYGPEGMILAVETIMEPASESMESRKEGLESFRGDGQRDGFRDGVQHDRPNAEGTPESE